MSEEYEANGAVVVIGDRLTVYDFREQRSIDRPKIEWLRPVLGKYLCSPYIEETVWDYFMFGHGVDIYKLGVYPIYLMESEDVSILGIRSTKQACEEIPVIPYDSMGEII